MSDYTKGPWKLRCEGSICVVDAHGNAISYSDTFLPNEQCKANARLQATAPELLEALKTVYDSTAVLNHLDPEHQQMICAAIAKAVAL